MGCSSSACTSVAGAAVVGGGPNPAKLCRGREALVRAAAERRFALAEAHSAYFQALPDVGEALCRFTSEVLVFHSHSASPEVLLPPGSKAKSVDSTEGSPLHPLDAVGEAHIISSSSSPSPSPEKESGGRAAEAVIIDGFEVNRYDWYRYGTMGQYYASATRDFSDGWDWTGNGKNAEALEKKPSTPPPPVADWSYFNLFPSSEDLADRYLFHDSPSSAAMREREGIPELEEEEDEIEEIKVESISSEKKKKDVVESVNGGRKGKGVAFEPEDKSILDTSISISNGSQHTDTTMTSSSKSCIDKIELVRIGEETEMRDVSVIMEEIRKLFSQGNGRVGVGKLLEVGKVPYGTRSSVEQFVSSRILEPSVVVTTSCLRFEPTRIKAPGTFSKASSSVSSMQDNGNQGSLLSTLEMLYLWEKRLRKVVKDQVKLGSRHNEKVERMKYMADKYRANHGEEAVPLDSARLEVKELEIQLDINQNSINDTSRKIAEIRDTKLREHLARLTKGLEEMWKSSLADYDDKLSALENCKDCRLSARIMKNGNSVTQSIADLERQLARWEHCFAEWVRAQKSFASALNKWLREWIHPDDREEQSEDGPRPFSPSRLGTPAVFIISNDWSEAIGKVSEAQVSVSIKNFIELVHNLRTSIESAHGQRVMVDNLAKEYSKKLRASAKSTGVDAHLDVIPVAEKCEGLHDEQKLLLEAMKRNEDEERSKLVNMVKGVNDLSSKTLEYGLIPVFLALVNFFSANLQAYQSIRYRDAAGAAKELREMKGRARKLRDHRPVSSEDA